MEHKLSSYLTENTLGLRYTVQPRLTLFKEIIGVYCEIHAKHTNTLCGQNAEFWYVKSGGTYSNHWV
jgi:hypothetical protein